MAFHCRDCAVDFGKTLPDGSCPECYSSTCVDSKIPAFTQSGPTGASPLKAMPAGRSDVTIHAGSFPTPNDLNGSMDAFTHQSRTPTPTPILSPNAFVHMPPYIPQIHPHEAAPLAGHIPPVRQMLPSLPGNMVAAPNQTSAFAVPNVPKYKLPRLKEPLLPTPRPQTQSRETNYASNPNLQPNYPMLDLGNGYMVESDILDPKLLAARTKALQILQGTDDSSFGRLFLAVQQLRKVTLGRIAKCSNASALVSEAPLLQYTLELLEEFKDKTEEKFKEFKIEASLHELTYGRKRSESVSSDGGKSATGKKPVVRARERKVLENIAVRQLPPQLQETDLTNYFAQFCPQRSDVKHVRIIQTPNHARSKAYAVVKLASDELARFICEKGQHTIKGHPVMVELHDEEANFKRKMIYDLFIGGLMSFTEESFQAAVTESYGEIQEIYFHEPEEGKSGNAYAYVTFEDHGTSKKLLEKGHLLLYNRKYYCKPHMKPQQYVEEKLKKKEVLGISELSAAELSPKKLPEKRADDKSCVVCFDEDACMMFDPCHHVRVCETCSRDANMVACPMCRTAITRRTKLYL